MSCLLIEVLEFIKKQPEGAFSIEKIASQLKVSPKIIRYYAHDFVDTGFVGIVSSEGKEHLRALQKLLEDDCEWMKHKPGAKKNDNKVPYAERISIKHIRKFYDLAGRQKRDKKDEFFVDELSRRLLCVGERTTVYSKGSAGKWLRCLDELRRAASISEKVIAIDSLVGFLHGRGRIAPLIIKADRSTIVELLNSVAKE